MTRAPVVRAIMAYDGATAKVKRIRRNLYMLKITSRETGHARWGTLAEIETDIEHFVSSEDLPTSGTSW